MTVTPSTPPQTLQTWSELQHVKDTGTALSLLLARAHDVRAWAASRLAANVSSRRRSIVLLVGQRERGLRGDYCWEALFT